MGKDYFEVRVNFEPCNEDITDLAASFLADAGFETFEPDAVGLTAYIAADATADAEALTRESLTDFPIPTEFKVSSKRIEGRDWNEEWEKNYFQPIVIEGECVVHSSFHKDVPQARYEIVIDPKMAFGTGHHHTTSRMAAWLLSEDLEGKSVTDIGTGTGILAMLASMRGAASVTGIEIDPDAWANAVENVRVNGLDIRMICGDASALRELEPADYLLANINRNIILSDIAAYARALKPGGAMLLSGFYDHDLPMIEAAADEEGLEYVDKKLSADWCAAKFRKRMAN